MPSLIFDLILLAVLLFIIIRSCVKGFFETVFGSLRLLLSVMAAYFLGKPVADFMDQKFIYGWTYNGVYDKIDKLYQSASDSFDVQKIFSAFPKFLISQSMREKLENSEAAGEELVISASETVAAAISHIISVVIAYVLVFVAAWILLWLLTKLLGVLIHKIPVVGKVDHILGLVIGVISGWIILSLICSLFRFFLGSSDFYTESHVLKFFAENPITRFIPFLNFETMLSKIFSN